MILINHTIESQPHVWKPFISAPKSGVIVFQHHVFQKLWAINFCNFGRFVVDFCHKGGQIWFWWITRLKAIHQCSKTWGYKFFNSMYFRSYRVSIFAIFAILGGSFLPQRHLDGTLMKNLIESPPSVLQNVGL